MTYGVDVINQVDPEVASAIQAEVDRQESHIELIASENFTSRAVQLAAGNPLTNKYAEGYPGNRYYGGCEYVDVVENIAIDRAKKLFGCTYANVQPHSGVQALSLIHIYGHHDAGDGRHCRHRQASRRIQHPHYPPHRQKRGYG